MVPKKSKLTAKERNRQSFEEMYENMDESRKREFDLFLKEFNSDLNKLTKADQLNMLRNVLAHNINALPKRSKNIKVDVDVWNTLNSLKEGEQTFNDVIVGLLGTKTLTKGNKNLLAIKYKRKRTFFTTDFAGNEIGCEFEYNDAKGIKSDFTFDIKIKKIFVGKQVLSPSEFFGTDNTHKHYSREFLIVYLKSVALALRKEFGISFKKHALSEDYENLVMWRKLYYEYRLSEDSFTSDVEDPLRLTEAEQVPQDWSERINRSLARRMSMKWDEVPMENKLLLAFGKSLRGR